MDMEKLGRELMKGGRADKLKAMSQSEDAKRLTEKLDASAVEKAAATGDTAALQSILRKVLDTDEGKRLARQLSEAMK